MRCSLPVAVFLIGTLPIAGCKTEPPTPTASESIAVVDGKRISVDDFERSYVEHLIGTGENDTYTGRYRHLQAMIDNVLLADEAVKIGLDSDSLYKAFRARETKKALGGRFYESKIIEDLEEPTETEVREAFFRTKNKVIVRHLFYTSRREVDAAYARLQSGVSFLDEAQLCYNTPEYDSTAGYLGPISYLSVDDAFAEAAFGLEVGQISEPVRSRVGYHIILVEDRIQNPLITESEFQTRRGGVTDRLRIRHRRLTGDSFVLDYMSNLDVVVNPEGVAALNLAIKAIENRAGDTPVQLSEQLEVAPFDLGQLAETFNPETVLAEYTRDGEQLRFTAGDYYFWLRDLPFQEASNRTAASVGRALRNEVFAQAAIDAGFENDDTVLHQVDLGTRRYLASTLRLYLSSQPNSEPDEELIRSAFESLGLGQRKTWRGSFSVIPTSSYQNARRIEDQLTEGTRILESFDNALVYENVDLRQIEPWGPHAIRSMTGEPTVVVLGDDRAGVLLVHEKSSVSATYDDYRESLRQSLLPHVNEYTTVSRLREERTVRVDSVLFELIMDLDRSVN